MMLISGHMNGADKWTLDCSHKSSGSPAVGGSLFAFWHLFGVLKKKVNQRQGWVKTDLGLDSSSLRKILLLVRLTLVWKLFFLGRCLFLVSPSPARRSRAWGRAVACFLSRAVRPYALTYHSSSEGRGNLGADKRSHWRGAHITLGVRGCLLDLLILTPLALFSERPWKQLISKPGRHPKSTWVNLGQGTCLQLFEDVYLFMLLN